MLIHTDSHNILAGKGNNGHKHNLGDVSRQNKSPPKNRNVSVDQLIIAKSTSYKNSEINTVKVQKFQSLKKLLNLSRI